MKIRLISGSIFFALAVFMVFSQVVNVEANSNGKVITSPITSPIPTPRPTIKPTPKPKCSKNTIPTPNGLCLRYNRFGG